MCLWSHVLHLPFLLHVKACIRSSSIMSRISLGEAPTFLQINWVNGGGLDSSSHHHQQMSLSPIYCCCSSHAAAPLWGEYGPSCPLNPSRGGDFSRGADWENDPSFETKLHKMELFVALAFHSEVVFIVTGILYIAFEFFIVTKQYLTFILASHCPSEVLEAMCSVTFAAILDDHFVAVSITFLESPCSFTTSCSCSLATMKAMTSCLH